jgi:lipoprotein-anchoring transpeptidase ErfK/SrfK
MEIRAGQRASRGPIVWGLALGTLVAFGLSPASAQYYPAPPPPPAGGYHGYYGAAPPAPPEELDVVELPPAGAPQQVAPGYPPPLSGPYAAQPQPVEPQVYSRVPAGLSGPNPNEMSGGARPPGDVGAQSAALPAAPAQAGPAGALPPEYQAEPDQSPKALPAHLRRQVVFYPTKEPPGTIVVDTPNTYLYLVLGKDQAMRYGIGVGREGFTWAGRERIPRAAEWPDWTPPKEMIERQPYLPRFMAGGPSNPMGARALYLGNTVYRIHGTNQPSTIGSFVSSGCIRLYNEDIMDLYSRVQVGTKVVVLPNTNTRTSSTNQPKVSTNQTAVAR